MVNEIKRQDEEQELDILFARHSIYTKNRDVEYYELLFRSKDNTFDPNIADEQATFEVIVNNYANVIKDGMQKTVPCFIKVTDDLLLNNKLPDLPKGRFVLSLLGRSKITPELVAKLKELGNQGVRLALSDYDPRERRFDVLLNIVHIIKLDIQRLGMENLPGLIAKLKPFHLELLADKVESQEQYNQCATMGFSLYQGFFLSEPATVRGKKIGANKTVLLQLLTEFDRPGANAKSIEELALNDPNLTYKILKVVNSAAFNTPKEIISLSHAISLLGMAQIKRWVVIFMTTGEECAVPDLVSNMLVRGRMCEIISEMTGQHDPISHFMVGLLSQLDVLLNIEMCDLLDQMPLTNEISNAILDHKGKMGEILSDVKYYQHGDFDSVKGDVNSTVYQVAYRHSIKWADQVMKAT
ncbi:MAG: HDOD/EAL domain-containing protein [Osedax symbiont Rs2]|nr:MAG: HDOD/EAL domain-containing protein [Osedax symbiont Rs1]EPJ53926.1 MAG: HDOD/EAL domain-containing protein [Osedax symbiont Rs2]